MDDGSYLKGMSDTVIHRRKKILIVFHTNVSTTGGKVKKTLCRKRTLFFAAVACFTLALFAAQGWGAGSAYAAQPQGKINSRFVIPGHIPGVLQHKSSLRGTAGSRQIQLSISLSLRNAGALDALLAAQNDPQSAQYHHYLTPQEFKQQFGPDQQTVNKVTSYLRSQGITVSSVASNNLLIDASGSVGTVEKAFAVSLSDYDLNGRTVYAPSDEPSVPDSLAGTIVNIGGLDNVAQYKPLGMESTKLAAQPHTGPGGGYTPSELRTAYDVNSLISGGGDGSGQTVAIFELDGYKASDINTYLSNYGLTGHYSNVLVDGASGSAGSGAIEVELDMEVVSAVAPSATQKIYIGPNTDAGVNDTYNKIVTDNIAKVTSTSWGLCESSSGSSELNTLDTIFAQGAAQGQSFFAAAGDAGAYDCGGSTLAVDSPASDPNVVGVGGTKLTTGSGGTYSSESAWNRSPNSTDGGGGGISSHFSRPSYQTGTNLTNANREVPDVSGDADPASGYSVYCTVTAAQCSSSNGWTVVGGTSAAAPLWAAISADTNGYLVSQSKPSLGSASSTIYKLYNTAQTYSAYHDVTSGNNLYYNATTGYDNATGIGTPDAWNFARDAAGVTTGGGGGGTTTQVLSNPGFESGQSPWQESSSGGYQLVDTTTPHSGSYSAYLGGYNSGNDQIWQTVSLPSTTSKVVLSYWVDITTQESGSTAYDHFYVRIRTSSGTTITTVQSLSNATATGWKQYSFDLTSALSSYKGQSVQVYFQGTTDSSLVTNFFVDDTALNVTA